MHHITRQFIKFVAVGILNTTIDFTVLNTLIVIFGLEKGDERYVVYKTLSFLAAVTNSFIFNKFWVFKVSERKTHDIHREIVSFLSVSLIGLLLNTLISSAVFSLGHVIAPIATPALLANIGALCGTTVVLVSNFIGYKIFVFKK